MQITIGLLLLAPLVVSYAASIKDPTRPLVGFSGGERVQSGWQLSSILISKQRRLAVINGLTVEERQSVQGATVVKILDDKVVLLVDGSQRELQLLKSIRQQN